MYLEPPMPVSVEPEIVESEVTPVYDFASMLLGSDLFVMLVLIVFALPPLCLAIASYSTEKIQPWFMVATMGVSASFIFLFLWYIGAW